MSYGWQGHNNYGGYPPPQQQGGYYDGPPPTISYGDEPQYQGSRAFPGQGGQTYGGGYQQPNAGWGAPPPPGPPPPHGNYGPPPGPPGGHYGPPQGPPPGQYGGGPPPTGPRPPQQNRLSPQPPMQRPPSAGHQYSAPPTGEQSYHGQAFRYSNCSGRHKALCIGINYFGTKNALRGCINDARAVSAFLQDRYGYKKDDMVILTDDQQDPRSHPTKQNILRGMQWLVQGAQPNDTLFVHYSGHGGQAADQDGDEDDGFDEVIYPVDFKQAGHITDDQMNAIMVRPLPPGVRLTALFDSCHSGTVLDLPFTYSTDGSVKEPNLAKDGMQSVMGALNSYSKGDLGGAVKTFGGFLKKATVGREAEQRTKQTRFSPADIVMISGCKDSQTSADAMNAGTATGAMSYAFITVMTRNPEQSYISLLREMRDVMRGRYSQLPQLSSSHPIDTRLRFIM